LNHGTKGIDGNSALERESFLVPRQRREGIHGTASLYFLFPIAALILFHWVNIKTHGHGAFIFIPWNFLVRINELTITFPDGFFTWWIRTAIGLLGPFILGLGILGKSVQDRWLRILISFPVGLAFVGVALEALAMAHSLNRWTAIGTNLAALIAGILLSIRAPNRGSNEPLHPVAPCSDLLRLLGWTTFGVTTLFCFEHALLFPPNYWDALIYYLYYSKLIFLEGAIPFPVDSSGFSELVQGQVGLGLGANYPHLFLLWQAGVCTLFGEWSGFPGQWLPPLCGLATAIILYRVALVRWRSERLAIWALILVQSVPYWLWYQNWVSDYPLAVYFTISAVALIAIKQLDLRILAGLVAIAIGGSHLNYLMVTLWWFPFLAWWCLGKDRYRPRVIGLVLVGLGLSSVWFIRNWIVTGNPVYAFFPNIFGGLNVDLDVLRSCEIEWTANGDGVGGLGHSLWDRLRGTPRYFLFDSDTSIKWATLTLGWFVPGLFFLVRSRPIDRFWIGLTVYSAFLILYQYTISGLYLYHILPVVPLLVLIACFWMERIDRHWNAVGRIHTVLVFLVALTVGLPVSMMGAKFASPELFHTVKPGHDPDAFLRSAIGPDYELWSKLEFLPEGSLILTHENRHYYLRDDLRFIHLDDARLIPSYDKSADEVVARLKELGVDYYLRIPNEKNHPITQRLGIERLLGTGFRLLYEIGDRQLYVFRPAIEPEP